MILDVKIRAILIYLFLKNSKKLDLYGIFYINFMKIMI